MGECVEMEGLFVRSALPTATAALRATSDLQPGEQQLQCRLEQHQFSDICIDIDPRQKLAVRIGHSAYDLQQQFARQTSDLWQPGHLGKIFDDQLERILLDVIDLGDVRRLERLQYVLVRNIMLQRVLAEGVQPIVG